MIRTRRLAVLAVVAAIAPNVLGAQVFNGGIPGGYVCAGTCGTSGASGVVTLAPGAGSQYGYVTTMNGVLQNPLGISGTTNGSVLSSGPFSAEAGQSLSFLFNYVTSDGAGFSDYAYVQLLGGVDPVTLFTARTITSGNTVPGFGLPGLAPGVVLVPASTAIIPGGPVFGPLDESSGGCYDAGCGFTGWIQASYAIPTAGTYSLAFGVFNIDDQAFQSALAFDFGSGAGGTPDVTPNPTVIPEPASLTLMATGLVGMFGIAGRRRRQRWQH